MSLVHLCLFLCAGASGEAEAIYLPPVMRVSAPRQRVVAALKTMARQRRWTVVADGRDGPLFDAYSARRDRAVRHRERWLFCIRDGSLTIERLVESGLAQPPQHSSAGDYEAEREVLAEIAGLLEPLPRRRGSHSR